MCVSFLTVQRIDTGARRKALQVGQTSSNNNFNCSFTKPMRLSSQFNERLNLGVSQTWKIELFKLKVFKHSSRNNKCSSEFIRGNCSRRRVTNVCGISDGVKSGWGEDIYCLRPDHKVGAPLFQSGWAIPWNGTISFRSLGEVGNEDGRPAPRRLAAKARRKGDADATDERNIFKPVAERVWFGR